MGETEKIKCQGLMALTLYLFDFIEYSVQFVEAVVTDDQLTLALGRMLYRNFGAQLVAQLQLESAYIGVDRRGNRLTALERGSGLEPPYQSLCLPNGQASFHDLSGGLGLTAITRQTQQGTGMAHVQAAIGQ